MSAITQFALSNFLPFRSRVELPLANQGLVLIQGQNEVSQALSSNGAGKTTIPTGICWTLFGETLEGIKADDVICRFGDPKLPCVGEAVFEAGWAIKRTRRPGSLQVMEKSALYDGKEAQEVIEARLGFGLRMFKNAVVFGQGAFERFALAEQSDQLRMLDEIQGLDFKAALKRAQDWGRKAEQDVQTLATAQEATRVQIAGTTDLLATLTRSRETFAASKAERIAQAEAALDGALAAVKEGQARRLAAEQAEKALPGMRQRMAQRVETSDAFQKAVSAVAVAGRDHVAARAALDAFQTEETALTAAGRCPTCKQVVSSGYVTKAFALERNTLLTALTTAEVEQVRTNKLQAGLQTSLAAMPDLSEEIGRARAQAAMLPQLQADTEAQRNAVTDCGVALVQERKASWDAEGIFTTATQDLAQHRQALADAETSLTRARTTAAVAAYWIEAFGDRGIRSLLFDSVADFLNARLRHHLSILAAGEATTRLSAQTALKKGGARESISVSTEWAWGGIERGSGGQDRRRDLALFGAMQDLAESRSAHPFPLRVWDEPGDALDARGQELFAAWVSKEARKRGTGLLITHSEQLASFVVPDQVWTVVMRKNGATVER